MGRGVGAKVITADDKPLHESSCTFCGSCVDVCPVNALLEADRWRKGREWEYEKTISVCLLCGNGCDISVSTKEGRVAKINSGGVDGSAEKYICAYGRFGFDCIEAETRVTSPMKKVGNELEETTWEDAISIVAERLKKAGASAGFVSTAGIMNEDALVLKQLAASVKSKNLDTTASLYSDADSLKNESADIDSADLIMLVGLNPNQWTRVLPALDAAIRRRVNSGAKLIVVNSGNTNISAVAALSIKGDEAKILSEIAQGVISKGAKVPKEMVHALASVDPSDDAIKGAELFMAANNPLIFSSPSLYDASANLSLIKGAAVAVPIESNAKGIILMGIEGEGKSYKEMVTDGMSAIYAIGELPLSKRPKTDFLVVQNSHMTELAKQADVVLPSAAFLEASGTMVDYMGRLKYLCKAIEPAGQSMSHREILMAVAKAAGKEIKEPKDSDIKKTLKAKPKVSLKPFKKKEGLDVNPQEMIESINASVINGSRLFWLKESEKAMAGVK
jgi:predicted molibdopterin-dependent oxidoreductase YjgC